MSWTHLFRAMVTLCAIFPWCICLLLLQCKLRGQKWLEGVWRRKRLEQTSSFPETALVDNNTDFQASLCTWSEQGQISQVQSPAPICKFSGGGGDGGASVNHMLQESIHSHYHFLECARAYERCSIKTQFFSLSIAARVAGSSKTGKWSSNFNQPINRYHMKDHAEIGHLTMYDVFRANRDQVMDLEIWLKIHTNVSFFETTSPKL